MIEKVSLPIKANGISEMNKYLKVGQLNDHMLNIIVTENRVLDFHIHEDSDEMFYVVDGKFQMEFDDGLMELSAGDFIIVPKGTRHRPVIQSTVKCLLLEKSGTLSRDNTGGTYEDDEV